MRTRKRVLPSLFVVAVAAMAGILVPAQSFAAQAGSQAGDATVRFERPMTRVGVDPSVARQHGYVIRTDANGMQYPVKAGSAAANVETPNHPNNTVPGNCGTSFVEFTAVDTTKHYSSIYTGFTVAPGWAGAVSYDWYVYVTDNYGASTKHWSGFLASAHFWSGTNGFTSGGAGWAFAELDYGMTVLWDGTICFAGEPWAQAYL